METTIVPAIQPTEVEKYKQRSTEIVTKAKTLAVAIKDDATLQEAIDYCLAIRKWRKEWKAYNEPERVQIQKLQEVFRDRVRMIDEPMERAEDEILEPAISTFQAQQAARRRAEDQRRIEEARKREEDARLAKAAELEAQGQATEAEMVLAAPQPVMPEMPPPAPKVQGGNFREVWDFRVTDPALIPREYLVPDLTKIRQVVTAFKGETRIPGIEAFPKPVLSSNPKRGA